MSIETLEHDPSPTPQQKVHAIRLGFAVATPPLAWAIQILMLGAFANYTCFPADTQVHTPVQAWVHPLSIAVDAIALVLAAASAVVAWLYLRDHIEPHDARGRLRLGRLNFVAMGGVLSGCGFFATILFETIATLMVPPCAG
jgi:hypothetical protein